MLRYTHILDYKSQLILVFVVLVDHSSVKLKLIPGVECSDYINANYVTVSGIKK